MERLGVTRLLAETTLILTAITLSATSEPDVVVLRAALGRNAHLPCGQGKVFLDGPDAFVTWFSYDDKFLYRFPNEETEIWSVPGNRDYGTTCVEGICYDNTSLLLKRASFEHIGRYRCRIHYQNSPAADFYVELQLVQAPAEPRLYDHNGVQIKSSYLGPVKLGDPIYILCEVQDDQPQTVVYWKRNGIVLEKAHISSPGVLRAVVHVENATRDELDAHYECLVQNADVTDPLVTAIIVKMNLPPLSVEIRMNKKHDFEAGQPRVVDCVVIGCVPPPTVTWHLGDKTLRSNVHKELHDGNYTVSSLTLSPAYYEDGRELVCNAINVNIKDQVFEDRVTINVGYRPHCVSSREQWIGVVVGEAEAVFCLVDASPAPAQFSWTFADSHTLFTSPKRVSGYKTRYSSGLTWLPQETDYGLLECRAINSIGEQIHACTYNIGKGGPPKTPRCFMQSDRPLKVQCKTDSNGGRPQTIHLELYNAEGQLLRNVTEADGYFKFVESVEKGGNLSAVVYASNMRGRSESRTIRLEFFRHFVAASTEPDPAWMKWLKLSGWVTAVIIITNLFYVLVRVVCNHKGPEPRPHPDLVADSPDGSFHREPDITREDRLAVEDTSITINQAGTCEYQCASPARAVTAAPCRALLSCRSDACSPVLSYYV